MRRMILGTVMTMVLLTGCDDDEETPCDRVTQEIQVLESEIQTAEDYLKLTTDIDDQDFIKALIEEKTVTLESRLTAQDNLCHRLTRGRTK